MMAGVREVLGLKTDGAASSIGASLLAALLILQKVGRIKLDTRQIRGDLHADTTLLGNEFSAQCVLSFVLQHIVVVVTAGLLQRLVVRIDTLAAHMLRPEIHRGSRHIPNLSGGNQTCVARCKCVCVQPYLLLQHRIRLLTVQIKVGMIGQVKDGIPVCLTFISNLQLTAIRQCVGYGDIRIARIPLIPIGTM